MKVRIRQSDDLDAVEALDRAIFYTDVRVPVDSIPAVWWLAERMSDGEPVAFAGLQVDPGSGDGFLVRAGVLPEARGLGLQRRLIRVRVAAARQLRLSRVYTYVVAANFASQRSLIDCGFRPYSWCRETADGQTFLYYDKRITP